jgi:hypothetical protein
MFKNYLRLFKRIFFYVFKFRKVGEFGPVHYDFTGLFVEVLATAGQPYFLLEPQLTMAKAITKNADATIIFFMIGLIFLIE